MKKPKLDSFQSPTSPKPEEVSMPKGAKAISKPLKKTLKKTPQVDSNEQKGQRDTSVLVKTKKDTTKPRHHDTTVSPKIEIIRKAVKKFGKEAATHRFTKEEKQKIADIVYTYGRQDLKTSENEIARVAINWLILDYKENGKESVLNKVLKALKE